MELLTLPICCISCLTGWQFAPSLQWKILALLCEGKWKIAVSFCFCFRNQLSSSSHDRWKCQTSLLSQWQWLNSKSPLVTEPSTRPFSTSQLIISMSHFLCCTLPNETETTWNAFFKPLKYIMIANLASNLQRHREGMTDSSQFLQS